ncbi:hypothetical protein [Paenibacillus sp. NRS-1760]|uniref:hypothetical protein n=1 Tax=Paenibacillus sp. NRS-1760 TaxID=3233902 RepID=UPI003D2DFAB2
MKLHRALKGLPPPGSNEDLSTQAGDQGAAVEQGKGDVAFAKRLSAAQIMYS